ncbi:hypothetical protein G3N55_08370 [Dissulfurirhabdus thermomarina]|uniref:ABC transporter substrate-binding protein n=1 Tax=Dissulfurirhabdus thermomarina TaxID=1765737 RepID=A0A6N9TTU7_DISTH|nr:hypothetical protein [Dissulfurirhabdus thermomarina]NDY42857.1 hypothetical protein [Dissulfurirhabdus thermomarina]
MGRWLRMGRRRLPWGVQACLACLACLAGLAAGARSIVDAVIEQAGGRNVVRVPKRLVRCDLEFLLAAAPDVYVIQEGVMNPAPSDPRRRPNFALLPAVRAGRILRVDEALFSRPGPRSVQAVELLHAFLYPRAAEVAP